MATISIPLRTRLRRASTFAMLFALAACGRTDLQNAQRDCATVPYDAYSLCIAQQSQISQDRRTAALMLMSVTLDNYAQSLPQRTYAPAVGTTSCRWVAGAWMCSSF